MTRGSLQNISIRGWKSIRNCDLQLGSMNVLLGANGAGKSSLLSFFRLLRSLVERRLQLFIQTSGGANALLHFGAKRTPVIEADLGFQPPTAGGGYSVRLTFGAPDRLVFVEETYEGVADRSGIDSNVDPGVENPIVVAGGYISRRMFVSGGHLESMLPERALQGDNAAAEALRLLEGSRAYHFHDTSATARVRQSSVLQNNAQLEPDAGNLAAMLYLYSLRQPRILDRIFHAIRQAAPFIDDIRLSPDRLNPHRVILKWLQHGEDYELGVDQLSDGTLRILALATLLLQPEADLPLLIVLDEPEIGLHPTAIGVLAGMLRHAAHHCQILLATQSVTLANQFEPSEIIVAEQRNNESTFKRLDAVALHEWLDEYAVGDLWEKNVFGGGPY